MAYPYNANNMYYPNQQVPPQNMVYYPPQVGLPATYPAQPKSQGEPLKVWGTEATMNMDPVLLENIKESQYYKTHLFRFFNIDQIMNEIIKEVSFLEPFTTMSKIPSTAFCLLYKMHTLRVTDQQITNFLANQDSPYVRAMGILYLRYVFDPHYILEWLEDLLFDSGEIRIKQRGSSYTIGEFTQQMLCENKFCDIYLPRWPAKEAKRISQKVKDYSDEIPITKQAKNAKKKKKKEEKTRNRRSPSPRSRGSRRSPSPRGRYSHRSPSPRGRYSHSPSPSRGRYRSGRNDYSPSRRHYSPRRDRRSPSPRRRRSPSPPRGSRYRDTRRSPSPSRGRRAYRSPSPSRDYTPSPEFKRVDLEKLKSRYGASTSVSLNDVSSNGRSQTESDRLVIRGKGK